MVVGRLISNGGADISVFITATWSTQESQEHRSTFLFFGNLPFIQYP